MEIKQELRPYVPLAQMLVQTLGPDCEVVLHDLDTPAHSVVYVENPSVTGKQVILSDDLKENFVANYYFTAPNGKHIRSSSLLIKNARGNLTGAMCINLDTTRLSGALSFLQSLLPPEPQKTAPMEQSAGSGAHVSVLIENLMDNILNGSDAQSLTRDERLEKIRFMDEKGLFLMKGSVEKAAEKLGVGKVTIYSYLDEVRGKRG